jgi:hypothetical protein
MENYALLLLTISAGSERLTEYAKTNLPASYPKSITILINIIVCLLVSFVSSDLIVASWPIANTPANSYVIVVITGLLASSGSSYINSTLELIKTFKGVK